MQTEEVPSAVKQALCPVGIVQRDCDGGSGRVEGDRVNGGPLLCHGNGSGS